MAISNRRLLNLERKLKNLLNPGNELKPIPTDFSDFVKNCEIRSGSEMKLFSPYKYQEILVKLRRQFNQIIICKSRQLGCTQVLSADDVHQACMNQAFSSCFFQKNQKDVTSLSLRIKQMIHGLKDYGITLDNDTQSYIRIKNKGDIYLRNSSKEGTRSLDSLSRITWDESAFLENIQHIYESSAASSSLVENCSKVLISTPSAKGGFYWDKLNSDNLEDIELVCEKVASGELYSDDLPGFYYFIDSRNVLKVIIHWRCHPIYNQINDSYPGGYLQYRQDKDGLSEEIVKREFDLKFIDSSKAYFSSFTVSECIDGEDYEDGLDVNADSYWMGVDPNFSASGEDYFCVAVLKLKDGVYTLVNLYRKRKMSSEYHLYQTSKLIEFYRPKRVIVENNSGGAIIVEQLQKQHGSIIVGQRTSSENKHVLIGRILLALEKKVCVFPEKSLLIQELLNFRQIGNKLQASQDQHDDAVMALAHCLSGCPLANDEYSPFASVNFDDLLV